MYLLPEFLDEDFIGLKFPSKSHRVVANNSLIGNSSITTKDELERCARIICGISKEDIEEVSFNDLENLGISFNG